MKDEQARHMAKLISSILKSEETETRNGLMEVLSVTSEFLLDFNNSESFELEFASETNTEGMVMMVQSRAQLVDKQEYFDKFGGKPEEFQ